MTQRMSVSYKAKPVGGRVILGLVVLASSCVGASAISHPPETRTLMRFGASVVAALGYVVRDFRTPAAVVEKGNLLLFSSSWKPPRSYQLRDIVKIELFAEDVGFTLQSGEYQTFPLRRFAARTRQVFLQDLEIFRDTSKWPDRAA